MRLSCAAMWPSSIPQRHHGARGGGAGPARRRGQGAHRRQRVGEQENLPRGRHPHEHVLLGSPDRAMSRHGVGCRGGRDHPVWRGWPHHKQRIIAALQSQEARGGPSGDGINDAPALRTADVGISVDSAVDIAQGVGRPWCSWRRACWCWKTASWKGRKVFANILKYIRMGAQFQLRQHVLRGGCSAFLPYVPMSPIQILSNNLLYDFSQVPSNRRTWTRNRSRAASSGR